MIGQRTSETDPLNSEEREVMDALVSAWNAFSKLTQQHPDHQRCFRDGIHTCQSILMNRVIQRDYPVHFPKN